MKPWNTGAVETGLNVGEAEKPHNKNYPFLLETKAASYEATQAKSFLDGLAHELLEILNYYQILVNTRDWKTIKERLVYLKGLDIREAITNFQFTGLDKTILIGMLRKRLIQLGPGD